jgi:hypothetical protein
MSSFVELAMARVRSPVSLEDHVPEAVAYIGSVDGRDLPQPEPVAETKDSEQLDDASDEDDLGASREPRVRGRAPIFEHGQRSIASLMSDIERLVIALPDLYAVMRGVEVIGKDGATRKVTIAFRPRDGRFEVADAARRSSLLRTQS